MPARPRSGGRTRCMRTGRSARGPPDGGPSARWDAGGRVVGTADQRFWHSNAQTARSDDAPERGDRANITRDFPLAGPNRNGTPVVLGPVQPTARRPVVGLTTAETGWSSPSNGTDGTNSSS